MGQAGFLPRQRLDEVLDLLRQAGYRLVGPRLQNGAIVYTELGAAGDLPAGVAIDAGPGRVRAMLTDSPRQFAWANGPQALKPLLFRPVESLWEVQRHADGRLLFSACAAVLQPTAVLGARPCDLAALQLQDRHFLDGDYRDPHYASARSELFLIAVNCSHPAPTCFCASTGDGPGASGGYDLLLDELDAGFIVTTGSERGAQLLQTLTLATASDTQRDAARTALGAAARSQTRTLPPGDLYDDLSARREHPRWSRVAERCLACGNCTQVCPTCFCSREVDDTPLHAALSEHRREWDSCFTEGHSYIHGLLVRAEIRQRYRQWLTHKLGSWHRQYGRSGCVGCGRCIAWCPVGIDISEEVNALLQEPPNE